MADTNDLKSFAEKHEGSSPSSGTNLKHSLHFSLFCPTCKHNRSFITHKLYSDTAAFQLICHKCKSGWQIWLNTGLVQRIEKFAGLLILLFLITCDYNPTLSPPITENQIFLAGETSRIGRIFNLKVMSNFVTPTPDSKEYGYAGWSICNQDGKPYWIVLYNAPYIETMKSIDMTRLAAHEVCHIHLGHVEHCKHGDYVERAANECARFIGE